MSEHAAARDDLGSRTTVSRLPGRRGQAAIRRHPCHVRQIRMLPLRLEAPLSPVMGRVGAGSDLGAWAEQEGAGERAAAPPMPVRKALTCCGEVVFATIMLFDSIEHVRAFAGEDYEAAYVPPEARAVLARFEEHSAHYDTLLRPHA